MAPTSSNVFNFIETTPSRSKKAQNYSEIMNTSKLSSNWQKNNMQEFRNSATRNSSTEKHTGIISHVTPNSHSFSSHVKPKLTEHHPKDHSALELFGLPSNHNKTQDPSFIYGYPTPMKQRPRSTLYRPKDHITPNLLGTSAKGTHDSCFTDGCPAYITTKPKSTSHRPTYLGASNLFGAISKNSDDSSSACGFPSLIQRKTKSLNRPNDHGPSYLYGPSFNDNTESKALNQGKLKDKQYRPKDNITPDFFNSLEPANDEKKQKQRNMRNRPKDHNIFNFSEFSLPKEHEIAFTPRRNVRHRPKDHDISYLFGVSLPNDKTPATKHSLIKEMCELQRLPPVSPKTEKSRSSAGRSKDHDKTAMRLCPVPTTSAKKIAKGKSMNADVLANPSRVMPKSEKKLSSQNSTKSSGCQLPKRVDKSLCKQLPEKGEFNKGAKNEHLEENAQGKGKCKSYSKSSEEH